MLGSFISEYGHHLSNGPISPVVPSPTTASASTSFGAIPGVGRPLRYLTTESILRPPAYASPTRSGHPRSIAAAGAVSFEAQRPSQVYETDLPLVPTHPYAGHDGRIYQPEELAEGFRLFHELNPSVVPKSDKKGQTKETNVEKKVRTNMATNETRCADLKQEESSSQEDGEDESMV